MGTIQFVRNHSDLSTDRGFQFEFYCDRCGSGHRTQFETSKTGLLTEALDTAGGFLGGILGRAADVSQRVHSAAWEKAHDAAYIRAVKEAQPNFRQCPRCAQWFLGGILGRAADVSQRVHSAAWEKAHDAAYIRAVKEAQPNFRQCPRCTQWVCLELCWNETRGLCKECAPDLAVEMSAMQAEAAVDAAREQVQVAERERVTKKDFDQVIRATCPACGKPVGSGKFCAHCGAALAADKFCSECGSQVPAGVKFCPECGSKQG